MSADIKTREFRESPFEESPEHRAVLTLSELACLAGASPEMIEQLLEWDIIVPIANEPEPCFPLELLSDVRRMIRLHAGLGIDFASMPIVLDLLDRIATLEKRIAELEGGSSP